MATETESNSGRGRKNTRLPNGDVVWEAGREARFVSSPGGTVHEREVRPDGPGYKLDPKCGQHLPASSLWGRVEADSAEAAAERYGLSFCSKCFSNARRLNRLARDAKRRSRLGG